MSPAPTSTCPLVIVAKLGPQGGRGAGGEKRGRDSLLHTLFGFTPQAGPGGARLHPGSLGEVAELAGVVLLEPVDRFRRGFEGGDAVLFHEPPALAQGPLAHVRHQPLADREIDVDVHATGADGCGPTPSGVTQVPPPEPQVPIPAAWDAEFARRAEQLLGGARRDRVRPGRGHQDVSSRYALVAQADSPGSRDRGRLPALRQVAPELGG